MPVTKSAHRARTRALRILAREHCAEYAEIYEQIRAAAPDRYRARNQARMQLRQRYPDRYLETARPGEIGPRDRRACRYPQQVLATGSRGRADLRAPAYQELWDGPGQPRYRRHTLSPQVAASPPPAPLTPVTQKRSSPWNWAKAGG